MDRALRLAPPRTDPTPVELPQVVRSRTTAVIGVLVAFGVVALLIRAGGRRALSDHLYPVPEGDDRIVVEVLNATGKQGIARVGTRALRRKGVDVVFFGNADTTADSTKIILRRGSRERADWKAPEEMHP